MLRRSGAVVAALAFLCGFWAAPYTHAHHTIDTSSDEHHPHGHTLVHTHASPHAHAHRAADQPGPEPAGHEGSGEQTWSMENFVFQQRVPSHPPSPALPIFGEPHVQLTSVWLGAERPQPKAHGPPSGSPSGLRAPPAYPPAFS